MRKVSCYSVVGFNIACLALKSKQLLGEHWPQTSRHDFNASERT